MTTVENYNLKIVLLFLAVFIDLLGFGIIIPILPFYATSLGANSLIYGALIAVYSLMQFIFSPIWGSVSDKIGRRPVILIGLAGSIFGYAMFGISFDLLTLFISRTLSGIATSATLTVANAYVADITPPEKRGGVFGTITAAFGLGFAVGPGIGGVLAKYSLFGLHGVATPGMFAALLSFINLVGAYFVLVESLPPEKRGLNVEKRSIFVILGVKNLLQYDNAILYITLFSIVTLGFTNLIAAFALYAPVIDPSIDETKLGILYTYVGLVLFFSQYVIVRPIIARFGERTMVRIGTLLVLIGFLAIPQVNSFEMYFVTNTPLIIGIAGLNPSFNSLLSQSVPDRVQGEALGVNQGFASLMRTIGPVIAGGLMGLALTLPFYLGALIFFGLTLYSFILLH